MALFKQFSSFVSGAPIKPCAGAFGKHPVYADHFEMIGESARATAQLWSGFYREGIGAAVSLWREFPEDQRINTFDHCLIARLESRWVFARFWDSQDGATPPRRDFPLVCCIELPHFPEDTVAQRCMELLAQFGQACRSAKSPVNLRNEVARAQQMLDSLVLPESAPAVATLQIGPGIRRVREALHPHANTEALTRSLHALAAAGIDLLSQAPKPLRDISRHIRVSGNASDPAAAVLAWAHLLADLTTPESQFTIVAAPQPWTDILLGKPVPATCVCLKASAVKIIPADQIPYAVDPAFAQMIQGALGESASTPASPSAPQAEAKATAAPSPVAAPTRIQPTPEAQRPAALATPFISPPSVPASLPPQPKAPEAAKIQSPWFRPSSRHRLSQCLPRPRPRAQRLPNLLMMRQFVPPHPPLP